MKRIRMSMPDLKSSIPANPTCLGKLFFSVLDTNLVVSINSQKLFENQEREIIFKIKDSEVDGI